ncbi:MAG: hypothetical protein ACE149_14695 [Armatimonadota bacterium]
MASFDMALVDEVRRRLDATYEEALDGLEEADGDLLHALAAIERRRRERKGALEGGELIGRAVGLAREGKLVGLTVKLGDRVVRRLPLPRNATGAIAAAVVAGLLSQLKVDLVAGEQPLPEGDETAPDADQSEDLG